MQIPIQIHANTDLQVAALGHHTAVVVGQGGHRWEPVAFLRMQSSVKGPNRYSQYSLTFNAGDPLRELLHTEKVFEDVLACLVRLPFALEYH